MKNYILIWEIKDYPDMGGGTEYDFFDDIKQVEEKVNELVKDNRVMIAFCGNLNNEVTIKPVERVTRWEVVE